MTLFPKIAAEGECCIVFYLDCYANFFQSHLQNRCNTDGPPWRWRSRLSLETAGRERVGLWATKKLLVVLPLLYIALTDIKNVLGKNQIFLKKGLFLIIQSSDFSTRYQKKHSQKHFWGEEADARRLQILFLILAHYVCVLGCCCCCNNSCWVVNSLGSRITYISHLRTEQRPEVHLIRKYFWWPIMT